MDKISRICHITIPIQVEVYVDENNERKIITFPINYEKYEMLMEKYDLKKAKIKKITSPYLNICFKNIYNKGDKLFYRDSTLEIIGENLNSLSYYEEIQALSECFTNDVEELIEIIKEGKYHFYKNTSFSQIIEEIFGESAENEEDVEKHEEKLKQKGYYQTSTGVIYMPKKQTEKKYNERYKFKISRKSFTTKNRE